MRLKTLRTCVIEPVLARHGGRIVKLMGDGALVEFPGAVAAVEAAVEVQQAVAEQERATPETEPIRFRVRISLGDVVHEGGDLFGEGVNLAARLQALAEPGGICLARNVEEQVRNRLDVGLTPMGGQRLKNIAGPVEVWRVGSTGAQGTGARRLPQPLWLAFLVLVALLAVGAGGWWWRATHEPSATASPPPVERPAIAVLPFDDLGGGEQQQRHADGFTEDLIAEQARSREHTVIARNSVEAFKDQPTDVREIGRRLGVSYVLEGSLQLQPERLRVTAQLVDTGTGAHLWTERYDRPPGDLFAAVRDEVLTRSVGSPTGYDGPIWKAWAEAAHRRPTQSLSAWDYYQMAKQPYRRHDADGNAEARKLLEKAVELDAGFGRAWAFLSGVHTNDRINGWSGDRARSLALMRETGTRAAALDPLRRLR